MSWEYVIVRARNAQENWRMRYANKYMEKAGVEYGKAYTRAVKALSETSIYEDPEKCAESDAENDNWI